MQNHAAGGLVPSKLAAERTEMGLQSRIPTWLGGNLSNVIVCKEKSFDAGSWCNSIESFLLASVSPRQACVGALQVIPISPPCTCAELCTAHPEVDQDIPIHIAGSLDRQSHDASKDRSKLFTAPLSALQSQKVLPAKDMLSLFLSRRDQGSQRQPKVEDAVGATLSRSWQENTEPYSSLKPHKLHIFRKTDRNWKLQLCLIGGEEQKENLAPRRNVERGNVSSALEPP